MSSHTLSGPSRPAPGVRHRRHCHQSAGGVAIAALRIALGFVFLWAFLDKTFGLGYATPSAKAWINGGSPTKGFLERRRCRPVPVLLQHASPAPGGPTSCSWLGLFAIGVALILGVGLRLAAVAAVADDGDDVGRRMAAGRSSPRRATRPDRPTR